MILEEFISYKTGYYFLKDDSCLDFTLYKDCTDEFKQFIDGGFSVKDFYNVYDNVGYDKDNIAVLKTKFGSIVFNRQDDHEENKKFLVANSKNKPCAMFFTHRVSETHAVAVAENGKIKRYVYYGEDEHILEGEPIDFEKNNNYNLKLDKNGLFEDFIDEDFVYNYSVDFMGFDKGEDVEIIDFKFYRKEIFAKEPEYNEAITDNIIREINENLSVHGLTDVYVSFTKFENDKRCYIVCSPNINGEYYYVFTKPVENIKNKKEFKKVFYSALNLLAQSDYKTFKKLTLDGYFYYRMLKEFNYDICLLMIDNDYVGDVNFGLTHKDGEKLDAQTITNKMVDIKNFKQKNFKTVYKYIVKNLNPKTKTKFAKK